MTEPTPTTRLPRPAAALTVLAAITTTVLAFALTACTTDDDTPAAAAQAFATPTTTSPTTISSAGEDTFADTDELRDALNEIGLDCTAYTSESPQGIGGATDAGQCEPIGFLATYRDTIDTEAGFEGSQPTTDAIGQPRHFAVGTNWMVTCSTTAGDCATIAERLGGEFRIQEPS